MEKGQKTNFPVDYIMWKPKTKIKSFENNTIIDIDKYIEFLKLKARPSVQNVANSGWITESEEDMKSSKFVLGKNDLVARTGVFTGGANGIYWLRVDSVNENTLVIPSSYSGNTEETLSALNEALERGSQIATISAHGKLEEIANRKDIAHVKLPSGLQPRMAVIYNLRALVKILVEFGIVGEEKYNEIEQSADFLREETKNWLARVPSDVNLAKQIALYAAGRSGVFLSSSDMSPVAYKWKISWNENSKNVSFYNEYPEFNHNEFLGWSSHPIEKLFAVFNLRSSFDEPRIQKRFEISDRLLSGKRPAARNIELQGVSPLEQMLWGSILADFASIYLAILNNVNPTPVELIEKLKVELVK